MGYANLEISWHVLRKYSQQPAGALAMSVRKDNIQPATHEE